ncbi:hypothetical protein AADZ90_002665 [Aestuariibius sp. 2305UL40-4]|uniref:hypothetical protein n=1 Tax=Aestuariibius violaceus TaxID=3234132 RepID=UPI00345E6301
MIRVFLVLCLSLWGVTLSAQTIDARAGEHIGFTRLVFDLPDGTDWLFEPTERGYALDYGSGAVFDLDGLFERIPRERLTDVVDAGNGRIELVLACDCPAEAETFQGRSLVVDIRDRETGRRRPAGTPAARTAEGSVALPLLSDDRLTPLPQRPSISSPEGDVAEGDVAEVMAPPPDRVTAAREALLDSLSRAASEGLLDLANPEDMQPPQDDDPALVAELPPDPLDPLSGLGSDHILLRSQTAIEKARPHRGPNAAAESGCFDAALFDLAAWTTDAPLHERLANERAKLFGEFDRLDTGAALDLARAYLSFGFGHEARAVARDYGDGADGWRAVEAIAAILDEERLTVPRDGFAGCDGPLAVWAVLAGATAPGRPGFDVEAVQASLLAIPEGLRPRIGALLAQRILDGGDPELADIILRFSQSVLHDETILQARIDSASGQEAAGRAALEDLADTSVRVTPEALTSLIALEISGGSEVAEDLVTLAEALYREHRGGPDGLALAEALVDARISRREYRAAVDTAEDRVTGINRRRDLTSRAVLAATEVASDGTFLRLVSEIDARALSVPAKTAAADRLDNMRLPDMAQSLRGSEPFAAASKELPQARVIEETPVVILSNAPMPPSSAGPLAERREMIDRSTELRGAIGALLADEAELDGEGSLSR